MWPVGQGDHRVHLRQILEVAGCEGELQPELARRYLRGPALRWPESESSGVGVRRKTSLLVLISLPSPHLVFLDHVFAFLSRLAKFNCQLFLNHDCYSTG